MNVRLLVVGKLKEDYLVAAVNEYTKRLSRFCKLEIVELAEGKSVEDEGVAILSKLKGYSILADIDGKLVTSPEFAKVFSDKLTAGTSAFTLIIGGSDGVSAAVKAKADARISFGRVTYPHQLMRVILVEQLYRAVTINNNVTYHK